MDLENRRRKQFRQRSDPRRGRILLGVILLVSMLGMVWAVTATEEGGGISLGAGKQPAVASGIDGRSVVVMEVTEGDATHLVGQSVDPATDTEMFTVTDTDGEQSSPDIVALPSGEFLVAWEHEDGRPRSSEIRARRFDDLRRPLGIEFIVSLRRPLGIEFIRKMRRPLGIEFINVNPALGADDMGNVVIAWKAQHEDPQTQSRSFQVEGRRFDAATDQSLGQEFGIGQSSGETAPALAVQPTGEFIVSWEDPGRDIRAQVFDSAVQTVGETFRVNDSKKGRQLNPAATAALNGTFTIVWEQVTPMGEYVVLGRQADRTGRLLGPEFRLNDMPSLATARPDVSADGRGHIVATWRCLMDSGRSEIRARLIDIDSPRPLGSEFIVIPDGALGNPSVAPGGPFDFQVVWENESTMNTGDPDILGRCLVVPFSFQP